MYEHPIQFIRTEMLNFVERLETLGYEESIIMTQVDLSCENIIEHFNLETELVKEGK